MFWRPIILHSGIGVWAKSDQVVAVCVAAWYIVNSFPLDLGNTILSFWPFKVALLTADVMIRANSIHKGIVEAEAAKLSLTGTLIVGTLSGVGTVLLKNALLRVLEKRENASELTRPGW